VARDRPALPSRHGLDDNQYLITRHTDTEHEHIHLLVNRIRLDGEVASDSHDYRRHEVLMREIERDYSLQLVRPSIEAERRAATKGEIDQDCVQASRRRASAYGSYATAP
jgi:hypothetical protein